MTDAPFEKHGNATWAQCPKCNHWFHVAPALLRLKDVDLICPGCGDPFAPSVAKELIES